MENPESPVKSRKISILKELNDNDKSTFYLPRQYTVAVPEDLILQGISGRESLFYTGFTRFEMRNFYTELRASLTY